MLPIRVVGKIAAWNWLWGICVYLPVFVAFALAVRVAHGYPFPEVSIGHEAGGLAVLFLSLSVPAALGVAVHSALTGTVILVGDGRKGQYRRAVELAAFVLAPSVPLAPILLGIGQAFASFALATAAATVAYGLFSAVRAGVCVAPLLRKA